MENIILICIIVVALLLMIATIYNNKFKLCIIKINEAENNIDILLEKKKELLIRTKPIIKKELKLDDFLEDIEHLDEKNFNHFQMNDTLKKNYNELFKVLDENEKLFKSESLISIIEQINSNEEAMIGSIKFYNDSVVTFNELIESFPSGIIAFFKRYKTKEFYNNEKREIFEILNDK